MNLSLLIIKKTYKTTTQTLYSHSMKINTTKKFSGKRNSEQDLMNFLGGGGYRNINWSHNNIKTSKLWLLFIGQRKSAKQFVVRGSMKLAQGLSCLANKLLSNIGYNIGNVAKTAFTGTCLLSLTADLHIHVHQATNL